MKITVIYDNNGGEGLESGWGFSALVEAYGKTILFDTGENGEALIKNMEKLGLSPGSVDCVFISHGDLDHVGGLEKFLNVRGKLPLYVPASAYSELERFKDMADIHQVRESGEIFYGMFTTGEMGGIEQSLVVRGNEGNVIVCGCAHPGLENVIERARKYGKVYGVVGGFHGFDMLPALEEIRFIAPCHCTEKKEQIMSLFSCSECKVGSVFEIPDGI